MSERWFDRFVPNKYLKYFTKDRISQDVLDKQKQSNSQGLSQEQIDIAMTFDDQMNAYNNIGMSTINIQFEQYFSNKASKIAKYREMAYYPEISDALDIISDEAIIENVDGRLLELEIKEEFPEHITDEIKSLWAYLINDVFNYNDTAWELFRRLLVDGELYCELILNSSGDDIISVKFLPPHTMSPIYDGGIIVGYLQTLIPSGFVDVSMSTNTVAGFNSQNSRMFDKNQIIYVKYADGYTAYDTKGFLEASIRLYNQLKVLEDAVVVYRICLAGNSRVKTSNGWKYMKDIKIGDNIYSYNNGNLQPTVVTNFWNNGYKNTLKLRSKHKELICTPDHPILVKDNKTGKIDYVEAGKLIVKQHQLINVIPEDFNVPVKIETTFENKKAKLKNIENFKDLVNTEQFQTVEEFAKNNNTQLAFITKFLTVQDFGLDDDVAIKVCEFLNIHVENLEFYNLGTLLTENFNIPEFVNPEFARLFGFLIGDGSIDNNIIRFAEGVHKEVNEHYQNSLRTHFGNCNHSPTVGRQYGNFTTCSKAAVKILHSLGYIHGCKNKRIPSWVFTSSKEIKQAFIEGLSDADGCERFTKSGTWFSTIELSNKILIEDIKELWSSIGLSSGHIGHRIHKAHYSKVLNRTIRESEAWNVTLTKLQLPEFENVISVEPCENLEVYDLEVASVNHNFVVNHTVTHNCRAPERRIWNIYSGRMPPGKATEQLKQTQQTLRKQIKYDPHTGAMDSSQNFMAMVEDIWFLKYEDGIGSSVETLPGGQNLGEVGDLQFFQKKLYKTLKLPSSRWNDSEPQMYSNGKTDITREEIKFSQFIGRIQKKFKRLLIDSLMVLLRIRGVDNQYISEFYYNVKFSETNYYKQFKQLEILTDKFGLLGSIDQFIRKPSNPEGYLSLEYTLRYLFMMSDEEYNLNQKFIQKEKLVEQMSGQAQPEPEGQLSDGTGAEAGFGGGAGVGEPQFGGGAAGEITPSAPEAGAEAVPEAVPEPVPEAMPPAEFINYKGSVILEEFVNKVINNHKKYK